MTKGPEPARPEWPEAGAAGGADVEAQTFPETGALTAARVEDPWDTRHCRDPRTEEPGTPNKANKTDKANKHAANRASRPDIGSVAEKSSAWTVRPEGSQREKRFGAGAHRPVFVDVSGRRSRRVRRLGIAVGVACAGYAVVIVATLVSGNSTAPWLPVPGQGGDRPASTADTTPEPSRSAGPSGTGGGVPGAPAPAGAPRTSAPAAAGARPEPGTTPTGASAGPGHPGTSADPGSAATATGGPHRPSAGVRTPATRPTRPPVGTWPAPTAPDGGGTPTDGTPVPPDPSGTGSGGDGPGSVATGPGSPVPVTTAPHPTTTPGATTGPGPTAGPGPSGTRTPSPPPSASGVVA